MYHLIYVSHATDPFYEDDLLTLLKKCRAYNKKHEVTGMLVYLNERFMQVLEGPESTVNRLYEKIQRDPQHKKVSRILVGHSAQRIFTNWSMGFKRISETDFAELSGFTNPEKFFSNPPTDAHGGAVMTFLQLFYKKNFVDYPEPTTY
jgi:Sensors of blue-light using FAD